jgi:hypothetical protein
MNSSVANREEIRKRLEQKYREEARRLKLLRLPMKGNQQSSFCPCPPNSKRILSAPIRRYADRKATYASPAPGKASPAPSSSRLRSSRPNSRIAPSKDIYESHFANDTNNSDSDSDWEAVFRKPRPPTAVSSRPSTGFSIRHAQGTLCHSLGLLICL